MQAYTDEMYYINDYLKGRKPVITTGFPFYARSASQVIDRYTFNRLKDVVEIPDEVQMCCCELAETEFNREKQQKESGGRHRRRMALIQSALPAPRNLLRQPVGNSVTSS